MKILTDEEIVKALGFDFMPSPRYLEDARAIEQAILERIGEPVRWINPANASQVQVLANAYKVTGYIPLFAIKGVE